MRHLVLTQLSPTTDHALLAERKTRLPQCLLDIVLQLGLVLVHENDVVEPPYPGTELCEPVNKSAEGPVVGPEERSPQFEVV